MPNSVQIECYFKSAEIEKLCKAGEDIIIKVEASYAPDAPPTFVISADSYNKEGKAGKAKARTSGGTTGCPTPCP